MSIKTILYGTCAIVFFIAAVMMFVHIMVSAKKEKQKEPEERQSPRGRAILWLYFIALTSFFASYLIQFLECLGIDF